MRFPETASLDEFPKTSSRPVDFGSELQLHNRAFQRACAILAHERVLDTGCGTGQTYRDGAAWFDSRAWVISARCR